MLTAALCGTHQMALFAAVAETAPTLPPLPADAPRYRFCAECRAPLARGKSRLFCCRKCQVEFRNRMTVRGNVMATLVMVCRMTRNGTRGNDEAKTAGKEAVRQLNQLIDKFRDDDRRVGRMSAVEYFARRTALGYGDR